MKRKILPTRLNHTLKIFNKNLKINNKFLFKILKIYNGKTVYFLNTKSKFMLKQPIGNFVFTRKMGFIHQHFFNKGKNNKLKKK